MGAAGDKAGQSVRSGGSHNVLLKSIRNNQVFGCRFGTDRFWNWNWDAEQCSPRQLANSSVSLIRTFPVLTPVPTWLFWTDLPELSLGRTECRTAPLSPQKQARSFSRLSSSRLCPSTGGLLHTLPEQKLPSPAAILGNSPVTSHAAFIVPGGAGPAAGGAVSNRSF